MRAITRVAMLSAACLGMTWAQPAAQPPAPPTPARDEVVPPRLPEAGPEGVRPGGPGAERSRRRESGQLQIPAAFMERLRLERPELYERLSKLHEEDRPRFFQEIRALMRERGVPFPEVQLAGARGRRDSPEEQKCLELSRLYQDAKEPAEKERLKAELAEAIAAAFGARLRSSQERVARLEKQLQEFRLNLERLETNREKICAERLDELTKPAEWRWEGNW